MSEILVFLFWLVDAWVLHPRLGSENEIISVASFSRLLLNHEMVLERFMFLRCQRTREKLEKITIVAD